MPHFVYILQSRDGRYYTGYTTDLERRLKEHRAGTGAKFTRAFGAKAIVYHEIFPDKSSALKREAEIQGWPRARKRTLITAGHVRCVTEGMFYDAVRSSPPS